MKEKDDVPRSYFVLCKSVAILRATSFIMIADIGFGIDDG